MARQISQLYSHQEKQVVKELRAIGVESYCWVRHQQIVRHLRRRLSKVVLTVRMAEQMLQIIQGRFVMCGLNSLELQLSRIQRSMVSPAVVLVQALSSKTSNVLTARMMLTSSSAVP